jgi:hypothetical protein
MMCLVKDRHGKAVNDSRGAPIIAKQRANGDWVLWGCGRLAKGPLMSDWHGEIVKDCKGTPVLWTDTPQGQAVVAQSGLQYPEYRFAPPRGCADEQTIRQWWFNRWDYISGRCAVDVTVTIHAARCGDLPFLQWLRRQDIKHFQEYLGDPDVITYARAHAQSVLAE